MKKQTVASKKASKKQKLASNPSKFFYRVTRHLTTFGGHPQDKDGGIFYITEFKGNELLHLREQALDFYRTLLQAGPPPFILPYECPELFVLGKHAAHSLTMEFLPEDESVVYFLYGEDDLTCIEDRQYEMRSLMKQGIPASALNYF